MKLVIIESPYAGLVVRNEAYAKMCLLDSLRRGEAPFASHLLYTQVLDDTDPGERENGVNAGLAWLQAAELSAVYIDLGISPGMLYGIERAYEHRIPVEYRKILRVK